MTPSGLEPSSSIIPLFLGCVSALTRTARPPPSRVDVSAMWQLSISLIGLTTLFYLPLVSISIIRCRLRLLIAIVSIHGAYGDYSRSSARSAQHSLSTIKYQRHVRSYHSSPALTLRQPLLDLANGVSQLSRLLELQVSRRYLHLPRQLANQVLIFVNRNLIQIQLGLRL